jgi:hypothetical protein
MAAVLVVSKVLGEAYRFETLLVLLGNVTSLPNTSNIHSLLTANSNITRHRLTQVAWVKEQTQVVGSVESRSRHKWLGQGADTSSPGQGADTSSRVKE